MTEEECTLDTEGARMPPAKSKAVSSPRYRNRVIELRYCKPRDIVDHPQQWRAHPEMQKAAIEGVLREIGIAGVLLVYDSPSTGQVTAIDGHLRKSLDPDQPWPCVVLDVDDAESAYLLAFHDPLSALATADKDRLASLLQSVQSGESAVQAMLTQLAEREGVVPPGEPVGPKEFKEYDENIETNCVCPKCGYTWSGGE